jgi:hypothetical protein
MSYYDEVIKDAPDSLYMFDTDRLNSSGKDVPAQTGGVVEYGPPLVSGASRSTYWNDPSTVQAMGFKRMVAGTERLPFTLECWFRPTEGNTYFAIACNNSTTDGLFWNGTSVTFNLKLSSGYVGVSYQPLVLKNMHVVGVYTGSTLILYIDGNPVAQYQLTDAELALPIQATFAPNGFIYQGSASTTGVMTNAMATYYQILSADRIRAHFEAGMDTRPNEAASTMYGGVYEKIGLDQGDTFLSRTFNDQITYENAIYTCNVGETLTTGTDSTGALVASEWKTAIPLGQGGTDINGVKLSWVGTGLFSVSTSIDGNTWTIATKNNFKVPTITPPFDGVGKYLYIKVNFVAYAGEVESITVVGYKNMAVKTTQRPITLPVDAVLFNDEPVLSYIDGNGVYTPTGITIGATPDADPAYALGFWYQAPAGDLTVNVTPTAFYENGEARAVRTLNGRWTYAIYVFPAKTDAIVITGSAYIVSPTIYTATLTADMVREIYQSYTGYPKFSLPLSGIFSVNTPDVRIYSNDWSSSGSG